MTKLRQKTAKSAANLTRDKRSPRNGKVDAKKQRKRLEGELDALWGQIAHAKSRHCQWPGCINTERLTAHHFFHKSQGLYARWSPENSIILCYGHHIFQVHTKGDTEPIRDIMVNTLGQDLFDTLKARVRQTWKPSLDDLEAAKAKMIGLLDELIVRDTGI